jgi:hypothetical protein
MENQEVSNPLNQQALPNATAVLVLGILSIVFCFCYGIVGAALGIIAIVLASKANKLYASSPDTYTQSSFKNMKAGRVCAIIGLCLSSLYLIYFIIVISFYGALFSAMPWEEMMNSGY